MSRFFIAAVAVVGAMIGVATAQTPVGPSAQGYFDRNRNTSVTERREPSLEPVGIPAGSYRLYPSLGASIGYTDNVFADSANEQASAIGQADGRVDLVSNWSRHMLNFFGVVSTKTYFEADEADTYVFSVGTIGRADMGATTVLNGGASYTAAAEDLAQNPNVGLIEAVDYQSVQGNVELVQDFNRLRLRAGVAGSQGNYSDARLFNGVPQDQDFRDSNSVAGSLRGDFALTYNTSLFAAVALADVNYDQITPGFPSRDAQDLEALVGADFDLTNLTRGQVGFGVFRRDFDAPGLKDIEGLAANVGVDWFVTPLVTASFNARRGVSESALQAAHGLTSTDLSSDWAYSFRRNLTLTAGLSYSDFDYEGIDRQDQVWEVSTGADYRLNRWSAVTLDVSYATQESSGAAVGRDFDRVQALIGVRLYR